MASKEELQSRFSDLQKAAEYYGQNSRPAYERSNRSVNGRDVNQKLRDIHKEMKQIIILEDKMNRHE